MCCFWALFCTGPARQSHAVANSTVGTPLVLVPVHPLDLTSFVNAGKVGTLLGRHGAQSPKNDGA